MTKQRLERFPIDKDVPPPPSRSESITGTLRKLDIGDSFIIERRRGNLHASARQAGIRIATRAVDADHVRIWRVA